MLSLECSAYAVDVDPGVYCAYVIGKLAGGYAGDAVFDLLPHGCVAKRQQRGERRTCADHRPAAPSTLASVTESQRWPDGGRRAPDTDRGSGILRLLRSDQYCPVHAGLIRARGRGAPQRGALLVRGDASHIHAIETDLDDPSHEHRLLTLWMRAYWLRNDWRRAGIDAGTGEVPGERPFRALAISIVIGCVLAGAETVAVLMFGPRTWSAIRGPVRALS